MVVSMMSRASGMASPMATVTRLGGLVKEKYLA